MQCEILILGLNRTSDPDPSDSRLGFKCLLLNTLSHVRLVLLGDFFGCRRFDYKFC